MFLSCIIGHVAVSWLRSQCVSISFTLSIRWLLWCLMLSPLTVYYISSEFNWALLKNVFDVSKTVQKTSLATLMFRDVYIVLLQKKLINNKSILLVSKKVQMHLRLNKFSWSQQNSFIFMLAFSIDHMMHKSRRDILIQDFRSQEGLTVGHYMFAELQKINL